MAHYCEYYFIPEPEAGAVWSEGPCGSLAPLKRQGRWYCAAHFDELEAIQPSLRR